MRQEATSGTFVIEHMPDGELRLTLRPAAPTTGLPPAVQEGTVQPGTIDIYLGEGEALPTVDTAATIAVLNESGGNVGLRANTSAGQILITVPDGSACRASKLKNKVTCQVWAYVWRWVWDGGGPFGLPGGYRFKLQHERVQADRVLYEHGSADATVGGTGLKVGRDGRIA